MTDKAKTVASFTASRATASMTLTEHSQLRVIFGAGRGHELVRRQRRLLESPFETTSRRHCSERRPWRSCRD